MLLNKNNLCDCEVISEGEDRMVHAEDRMLGLTLISQYCHVLLLSLDTAITTFLIIQYMSYVNFIFCDICFKFILELNF